MPQMAILVIEDPSQVDAVVRAWLEAGVSGLTLLDSSGWTGRIGRRGLRDDLPLFPSARLLLRGRERSSRTIFSVVGDDFDIDALVAKTESLLGPLDEPDSGILIVLPVAKVAGLQPAPPTAED